MKKTYLLILLFFTIMSCGTTEQESEASTEVPLEKTVERSYTGNALNRFEQAIKNMEREDSNRVAQENEVLFIGSSSIRFWKNLAKDFDPIPVINRGFGGSILPEVHHYADRIIFPYQPSLIVLYCGENDISEGISPEQAFDSFKVLDELIRKKLPKSKLLYISMKPSIARWNLWPQYTAANELIRDYLVGQDDRLYVDCSTVMLNEAGEPDPAIFVEDQLHMNEVGYIAWTNLIRPIVEEMYASVVGEKAAE